MTARKKTTIGMKRKRSKNVYGYHQIWCLKFDIGIVNEMRSKFIMDTIFRLSTNPCNIHTHNLVIDQSCGCRQFDWSFYSTDRLQNKHTADVCASAHACADHAKQSAPLLMMMTCLYNILKTTYSYQQTNNNKNRQKPARKSVFLLRL